MSAFSTGFSPAFGSAPTDDLLLVSLSRIKVILGITVSDTQYDNALVEAGRVVTLWFEKYCRRGLRFVSDEIDDRYRVYNRRRIQLNRFPIEVVADVAEDGKPINVSNLLINRRSGWIENRNLQPFHGDIVAVTYDAGYRQDAVPSDLENAYAKCVGEASGYGTGDAADIGGGAEGLKKIALGPNALNMEYFDGGGGGGTGGAYDVSSVPPELQPYAGVLNFYVRDPLDGED